MKTTIIMITALMSLNSFAGLSNWFFFTNEINRNKLSLCQRASRTMAPGYMMKYLDMMGGTKYKVENEKRGKNGKVISLDLTKNPKGDTAETYFYHRSLEACEIAYSKLKKEMDKKLEPIRKAANEKYSKYE